MFELILFVLLGIVGIIGLLRGEKPKPLTQNQTEVAEADDLLSAFGLEHLLYSPRPYPGIDEDRRDAQDALYEWGLDDTLVRDPKVYPQSHSR